MPATGPPDDLWATFRTSSGKYDGEQFERLAFDLLKLLHPGPWRPTKKTHDGARDFVMWADGSEYWAECKAYSPRLSINVITPTLVMALIDSVQKLVLISRSDLNRNAVAKLARYRASVETEIEVYDGTTLENLLACHPHVVQKHFGHAPSLLPSHPTVHSQVAINRDLWAPRSHARAVPTRPQLSKAFSLTRFDVIRLEVSLKNNDAALPRKVVVTIRGDDIPDEFQVTNLAAAAESYSATVMIDPAGIQGLEVYLRAVKSGQGIRLPPIEVHDSHASSTTKHELGVADIHKLYQVPLVGQQFKSILQTFDDSLYHRQQPLVYTIAGRSGVGKSRLLHEFMQVGHSRGYSVQHYESEFDTNASSDQLIRQFVADVVELPFLEREMRDSSIELGLHEGADAESDRVSSRVLRIVYDTRFDLRRNVDVVIDTLVRVLSTRRTMLLIDNVQNRDDAFAVFLEKLVGATENMRAQFVLALAFNRDLLVAGSGAARILRAAGASAATSTNRTFFFELEPFSKADAAEFLNLALAGGELRGGGFHAYRHTTELFLAHVDPRPLNIWQTLMYLTDIGVLAVEREMISVVDPERLRHSLQAVPRDLQLLLEKRWNQVQLNAEREGIRQSGLRRAITTLYLLGKATRDTLAGFGVSQRESEFLIRVGICVRDSGGRLRFFHFQLFLFFRARCQELPRVEAERLRRLFIRNKLSRQLFQQFFVISHFAREVSSRLVNKTVESLVEGGATREYGAQYCGLVKDALLDEQRRRLTELQVLALAKIAEFFVQYAGFDEGVALYEEIFGCKLRRPATVQRHGAAYGAFLRSMANAYLAVHRDVEALEVIAFGIHQLDAMEFPERRQRDLLRCDLLNRRMATHKALGLQDLAVRDGEEALCISNRLGDAELQVLNHFDYASVFQKIPEQRERMRRHFEKGLSVFGRCGEWRDPRVKSRAIYARALLALCAGQYGDAHRTTQQGIAYARSIQDHFWGIRISVLQICGLLLREAEHDRDAVSVAARLTGIRDWWTANGVARSGWVLCYLEGKYALAKGEATTALSRYEAALRQLQPHVVTDAVAQRYSDLYHDISISLRDAGLDVAPLVERPLVPTVVLRDEMLLIARMSAREFGGFKESHVDSALFNNGSIALIVS